jgi:hypothetical protein
MKRNVAYLSILAVWFVAFCSHAAENPLVIGTIVEVQKRVHTKVLYYLVNTPVTRDDPYFEVSVEIRGQVYTGEYTPRHAADVLPEAWKPGAEVQVRRQRHSMFLKRPDGEDLEVLITRHRAARSQAPHSAPPQN